MKVRSPSAWLLSAALTALGLILLSSVMLVGTRVLAAFTNQFV